MPMSVEAEIPISPEELEVIRKQFMREGPHASTQTKFNYAWSLVRSADDRQIEDGVQLLTEIFLDSPERRRECLYYLAVGNYKLGKYNLARRFNDELLKHEPRNEQALELRERIQEKAMKEGTIGFAIVSGAIAVGAALLAALIKRSR